MYESSEQIVEAYYNGKLEKTYPMLVQAIILIIQKETLHLTQK